MERHSRARTMPVFRMDETDFYVDIRLGELRQVDNPDNRISMEENRITATEPTGLAFNTRTKNIYEEIIDPGCIPAHVKLIIVPPLKDLDPLEWTRNLCRSDDRLTQNRRRPEQKKRHKGHSI
jgi:hypothetical protein